MRHHPKMSFVDPDHALRLYGLPPHHRDPFDRMLIATALAGGVSRACLKKWGLSNFSPPDTPVSLHGYNYNLSFCYARRMAEFQQQRR
jgi:hypothetical protein